MNKNSTQQNKVCAGWGRSVKNDNEKYLSAPWHWYCPTWDCEAQGLI